MDSIFNGIAGLTVPADFQQMIQGWHGTLGVDLPHDGSTTTNSLFGTAAIQGEKGGSDRDGWRSKRYKAASAGGGAAIPAAATFEAETAMYVGTEKEGQPFNTKFRASLVTEGSLAVLGETQTVLTPGRIGITGQTRAIMRHPGSNARIPGAYMGVKGVYRCTANTDKQCATRMAAPAEGYRGFELGEVAAGGETFSFATAMGKTSGTAGGTWTFVPDDPADKVTEPPLSRTGNTAVNNAPETIGYGWWSLTDPASGKRWIGTVKKVITDNPRARGDVHELSGTAEYSGTAAGMYALYAGEGRLNDAGRFEADARLKADFGRRKISGTLDSFKGYDGMARDWTVELKAVGIMTDGDINEDTDTGGKTITDDSTVWTVGGKAGKPSGSWIGTMARLPGKDGLPDKVTGGFYSEYSRNGKMTGGFGAEIAD